MFMEIYRTSVVSCHRLRINMAIVFRRPKDGTSFGQMHSYVFTNEVRNKVSQYKYVYVEKFISHNDLRERRVIRVYRR